MASGDSRCGSRLRLLRLLRGGPESSDLLLAQLRDALRQRRHARLIAQLVVPPPPAVGPLNYSPRGRFVA